VGSAGGRVASADGKIQLDIPAGALAAEIEIAVSPKTAEGSALPGSAYELHPDGILFAKPIRVTLAYDPASLPGGVTETNLGILLQATGGLAMPMPDAVVDVAQRTVSADIVHFSGVAIGIIRDEFRASVDISGVPAVNIEVTWNRGPLPIVRAHVGHCPQGQVCPGAATHFGCREEDFAFADADRPDETTLTCMGGGQPPSCGLRATPLRDTAYAAGFYCYGFLAYDEVSHTMTVTPIGEVYSFGNGAPPPAPTDFAATAEENGSVRLRWTGLPLSNDDYLLLGYRVIRSGGSAVAPFELPASGFVDGDVLPETSYTYRLYAQSAGGWSPTIPPATVMTLRPPAGLPGYPPRFDALAESSTQVRLGWDEAALATRYYILRTGGSEPRAFGPPGTARELVDSGLAPGTTYTYTLQGENAIGRGPERTVVVTTPNAMATSCLGGLGLTLSPSPVTVGAFADVTVTINRGDVGQSITLVPTVPAASPLSGLVTLAITTGTPTTANTANLRITRASSPGSTVSGNVILTGSDGTEFGTCVQPLAVTVPPG
jgi:hypothetical protein